MRIEIRSARPNDAPAIAGIWKRLEWLPSLDRIPLAEFELRVEKQIQRSLEDQAHALLVAQDGDGEVLGYAAVHWLTNLYMNYGEGYLSELFVAQQVRGSGVGSKLLSAVKEMARERGCDRLMLITHRGKESYKRGFYAGQGWTERPEIANFILPLED